MTVTLIVVVLVVVCVGAALVAYTKRDTSLDGETVEQRQERQLTDRLERGYQQERAERDETPPTHEPGR